MWYYNADHPLRRYFSGLTEQTFIDALGVADPGLVDYLSLLLARFVHIDALHRLHAGSGKTLEEVADMMLEAAAEARRKLEQCIAALEDAEADELIGPCPVIIPVPQDQSAPPQQPGYPPGYKPNPVVEAMIAQFRPRGKK